jgi:hypothetical protein
MAIRKSGISGIPFGNTSGRPGSPSTGQPYFNGEIEALEIYNGTTWKVSKTEGFPPDAPTISSVTDSSTSLAYSSTAGTLDVVLVPAATGGAATQYNAYTTTGGHSGFTTVGSTVTITGLTPGTAYTVYGNAQNGSGNSTNTTNASPVTPTTLPQAPTIGTTTLSNGLPVVNWTLGSNGGKNLSAITITPYLNGTTAETPRTAATTSSTSYTFTSGQLTEDASYTFKVKTTNANGVSSESSASNSVTVSETVEAHYLVVAGGGGGGSTFRAGGGGAGGLRSSVTATGGGGSLESPLLLSRGTAYTVTVGGGGAGGVGDYPGNNGTRGVDSTFSNVTSYGGGGGAKYENNAPTGTFGSGGGGAGFNGTAKAGSTGTSGQGFAGGSGGSSTHGQQRGGGGGGAGAAGFNSDIGQSGTGAVSNSNNAGDGGSGVAVAIITTGTSIFYAGGGGSGSYLGSSTNAPEGGAGGGGNGGFGDTPYQDGNNGTANFGGGGGGSSGDNSPSSGGNGGSGVVIIRTLDTASSASVSPTTDGSYKVYKFIETGSITF